MAGLADALMASDDDGDEVYSSGDDMQEVKTQAASDVIDAVKSRDAGALADAFQRMYDACAGAKSGE